MVALLLENLIGFIVDNKLEVFEFKRLSTRESVLEPLWDGNHNVSRLNRSIGVTDATSDLCVLAHSGNDLLNLSDELSGVSDDYNLNSFD